MAKCETCRAEKRWKLGTPIPNGIVVEHPDAVETLRCSEKCCVTFTCPHCTLTFTNTNPYGPHWDPY